MFVSMSIYYCILFQNCSLYGPGPCHLRIPMLFNVFPYLSYEMDWNLFLTVPVSRQPNINCLLCISSVIETFDVLSPLQRKMPIASTAFPASYRCWTLILDPTPQTQNTKFFKPAIGFPLQRPSMRKTSKNVSYNLKQMTDLSPRTVFTLYTYTIIVVIVKQFICKIMVLYLMCTRAKS